VDLDGVRCVLVDTAGMEFPPAAGPLGEQEDQAAISSAARAISTEQARAARTQLLCLDASRPLNAWEKGQLGDRSAKRVLVMTKTDAPRRLDLAEPAVATSAATGEGIESLKARLRAALLAVGTTCGSDDVVAPTAARCRESLRLAAEGLSRADAICRVDGGEELLAAELRLALDELGRMVGAVYSDDVLDRVFSRFCVGK
jgi:tRNA modification GTPase